MVQVTFHPDGTAEHIGDQTYPAGRLIAPSAGATSKRRASQVEPTNWAWRVAFHAIRALAPDESRMAAWTRTWSCEWRVRVLGGPTFGRYADRAKAIAAEIAWLQENRL